MKSQIDDLYELRKNYETLFKDYETSKLNMPSSPYSDLTRELNRLRQDLQAAQSCSIDIKCSYDFYILSLKEFNKKNNEDAILYYDRAKYELTAAVNDSERNATSRLRYFSQKISYLLRRYRLEVVLYGIITTITFGIFIYKYSNVNILDVPIWSSFFAGLGASLQILYGTANDLFKEGRISGYKRIKYFTLPFASIIVGYMAYLISNAVLSVIDIYPKDLIVLFCFLAGFVISYVLCRSAP
ncbi:MAG: hypothetical protein JW986_11450 [Methanotrichaceae archaeon]|nr:hypothetical protein [Methanotrichaceae archaeon]